MILFFSVILSYKYFYLRNTKNGKYIISAPVPYLSNKVEHATKMRMEASLIPGESYIVDNISKKVFDVSEIGEKLIFAKKNIDSPNQRFNIILFKDDLYYIKNGNGQCLELYNNGRNLTKASCKYTDKQLFHVVMEDDYYVLKEVMRYKTLNEILIHKIKTSKCSREELAGMNDLFKKQKIILNRINSNVMKHLKKHEEEEISIRRKEKAHKHLY
ncbi:hypothetical protein SLOPH_1765 [Spraguea lophii 42_110]|uniref:Uncharacterized protein n=1 Tax=Spraguea lophii (strain 42_110) TaxID=1358809 RepID=S7W9X9_SPRLO|nr:hypothetical protein SLOPH_1765 [Spraguea lophii 42_110]